MLPRRRVPGFTVSMPPNAAYPRRREAPAQCHSVLHRPGQFRMEGSFVRRQWWGPAGEMPAESHGVFVPATQISREGKRTPIPRAAPERLPEVSSRITP